MRRETDTEILDILNAELQEKFTSDRVEIRSKAIIQIAKIQKENRDHHNKRCKTPTVYKTGDLVVIKRTQFGSGLKLKPNFLGPYRVTKVIGNERYEVEKQTTSEGPGRTRTSADNMKMWIPFETTGYQDGRM